MFDAPSATLVSRTVLSSLPVAMIQYGANATVASTQPPLAAEIALVCMWSTFWMVGNATAVSTSLPWKAGCSARGLN